MNFNDFWTNKNNPSIPKEEYLFGTRHIILLVSALLLCIVFSIIFYKRSEKSKRILMYVLASILLFFEIVSRIVNLIIEESYTWQNVLKILLPMHICSVVVWIFIIAVFSKNKTLINFSSIAGILATLAFLLYPAVGINRVYLSFTCLYSIISHTTGFVCAILFITLGFAKFEFKDIWKVYLCLVVMFSWGALLDFVIFPGSDYMYLVNDPLELNLPFPFQILYAGILILYIFMFYFISWIVKKIRKN